MSGDGTSVTLIFYRVGAEWWKEPALNLIAAVAQFSSYTHVEIAIGEVAGHNGMMANVARIFNDAIGVEICERTGRNPQVYTDPSLLPAPCVLPSLCVHHTILAHNTWLVVCTLLTDLVILCVFAVHVPFAGVLQGRGAAHARVRQEPNRQTVQ